jgi:hypothetical protein
MLGGSDNRGLLNRRHQRTRSNGVIAQKVVRPLPLGTASEDFDDLAGRPLGDRCEHPYQPRGSPGVAQFRVTNLLVGPFARSSTSCLIHVRQTDARRYKFREIDDFRSMARRKRGKIAPNDAVRSDSRATAATFENADSLRPKPGLQQIGTAWLRITSGACGSS